MNTLCTSTKVLHKKNCETYSIPLRKCNFLNRVGNSAGDDAPLVTALQVSLAALHKTKLVFETANASCILAPLCACRGASLRES